jgi:hypothetical protein
LVNITWRHYWRIVRLIKRLHVYLFVNISMKTWGWKVVNLVRYLCTQKVIVFTSEIARVLIKPQGRLNRTAVDVTFTCSAQLILHHFWHVHYLNWYSRCASRSKVVVREVNRQKRMSWCCEKRTLNVRGQWDKVIFFRMIGRLWWAIIKRLTFGWG